MFYSYIFKTPCTEVFDFTHKKGTKNYSISCGKRYCFFGHKDDEIKTDRTTKGCPEQYPKLNVTIHAQED